MFTKAPHCNLTPITESGFYESRIVFSRTPSYHAHSRISPLTKVRHIPLYRTRGATMLLINAFLSKDDLSPSAKTCGTFLRQKRSEKTPKTSYWIDAICINQDNLTERTHQVRFMGHIYFKAYNVLVWLGTGDPALRGEMEFLRTNAHDLLRNVLNPAFAQKEVRLAKLEYWFRAWIVKNVFSLRSWISSMTRSQSLPAGLRRCSDSPLSKTWIRLGMWILQETCWRPAQDGTKVHREYTSLLRNLGPAFCTALTPEIGSILSLL